MSDFSAHVTGLEPFFRKFQQAPAIVTDELAKAGRRAGLAVEAKAKEYVPVWRHDLQRSITSVQSPFGTKVTPLFTTTTIGTAKKYAAATEYGRPADAKMPPPGALLPWMASKGIAATEENITGARKARNEKGEITGSIIRGSESFIGPRRYLPIEYLIARAIKRSAPKPHPYLMKAFHELKPKIQAEFDQVPKRVIARLQGLV